MKEELLYSNSSEKCICYVAAWKLNEELTSPNFLLSSFTQYDSQQTTLVERFVRVHSEMIQERIQHGTIPDLVCFMFNCFFCPRTLPTELTSCHTDSKIWQFRKCPTLLPQIEVSSSIDLHTFSWSSGSNYVANENLSNITSASFGKFLAGLEWREN